MLRPRNNTLKNSLELDYTKSCEEVYNSSFGDSEGVFLGRPPQKFNEKCTTALFITVSPPPKQKVQLGQSRPKEYGQLTVQEQIKFLIRLYVNLYEPYFTDDARVIGTYELNSSGNAHMHFLVWDIDIQSVYQLHMFRKMISNDPITVKMMKKKQRYDFMNNIVICDDELSTIRYLDKDLLNRQSIKVPLFYT